MSEKKKKKKKKKKRSFFLNIREQMHNNHVAVIKRFSVLFSLSFSPLLKSKVTYLIVDSAKVGTLQKRKRRNICFILRTTEGALNLGETALSTCFS